MRHPINRLLEFDLSNKKSISIDTIVKSLLSIEDEEYFIMQTDLVIKNILKNNSPNTNKRIHSLSLYFKKQVDNDLIAYNKEIRKMQINKLEERLKEKLFLRVIKMSLALEDKNIIQKKNQLYKDISTVTIILKQMGLTKESEYIQNIDLSNKIYTYSSYTKEWKKKRRNCLLKNLILQKLMQINF